MKTFSQLLLLLVALGGLARADELPGFDSNSALKPYLFIIFDNSRSMRQSPNPLADNGAQYEDDYYPGVPDAQCRNKFCKAKRVLSNLLAQHDEQLGVGLGTYFQMIRRTRTGTGYNIRCSYDRMWKPGLRQETWTPEDKGASWACKPYGNCRSDRTPNYTCSKVGSDPKKFLWDEAWPNGFGGASIWAPLPGGATSFVGTYPPNATTPLFSATFTLDHVAADGAPYPIEYSLPISDSGTCPGSSSWFDWDGSGTYAWEYGPYGCSPETPCRMNYIGSYVRSGGTSIDTLYQYSAVPPAGYSLVSGPTPAGSLALAANGNLCPGGSNVVGSTYTETTAYDCTPSNPCTLTLASVTTGTGGYSEYFNRPQTAPPEGYINPTQSSVATFHKALDNGTQAWSIKDAHGSACTSVGQVLDNVTESSFGGAFANNQTCPPNTSCNCSSGSCGCTSSNPCRLEVTNRGFAMVGELNLLVCSYKLTQYRYPSNSSTTCTYNRSQWRFQKTTTLPSQRICSYTRNRYYYYAPGYQYEYFTQGGEYVDRKYVDRSATTDLCSGTSYSGELESKCPERLPDAECGTNQVCRLRWNAGSSPWTYGRVSSAAFGSDAAFCMGVDRQESDFGTAVTGWPLTSAPAPGGIKTQWCQATASNNIPRNELWGGYYSPSTSVSYSADPSGTTYFPVKVSKYVSALSWVGAFHSVMPTRQSTSTAIPSGTSVPFSSLAFEDIEELNATDPLSNLTKLSRLQRRLTRFKCADPASWDPANPLDACGAADDNPWGIRYPDEGKDDYTPLFGALTNTAAYLDDFIENKDNASWCRPYYVLLITDGAENTPKNYTNDQLRSAVANLRGLKTATRFATTPKDVKTFVVGFGTEAAGDNATGLNLMAREGGFAYRLVNGNITLGDPSGNALSAGDEATLSQALTAVFAQITAGSYSRSKPVLSQRGERVYAAYFDKVPDSVEWRGQLDAFALSNGAPGSTPVWRASERMNGSSQPLPRTLLTRGNDNATTAFTEANLSAFQTGLGLTGASANSDAVALVRFVHNASLNEPFATTSQTRRSRLGHIFHSSPVVVGESEVADTWADGTNEQDAFRAFKASTALNLRPPSIYISANDGMLHALAEDFSAVPTATAGTERWGYIPKAIQPALQQLRQGATFTVDGPLAGGNMCRGTCTLGGGGNPWFQVLMGGLGRGGRAIFALDVTSATVPLPLWEYTDPRLGETRAAPVLARTRPDRGTGPTPTWSAFLPGGFDGDPQSARGQDFFVLNAGTTEATGELVSSIAPPNSTGGTDQAVFSLAGGAGPGKNNLVAPPAIFRGGASAYALYAYFGDTRGRIHRMDVRSPWVRQWTPVTFFDPTDSACQRDVQGNTNAPVTYANGTGPSLTLPLNAATRWAPPIFVQPVVGLDESGRRIVYAATGDGNNLTDTVDPNGANAAAAYNYLYALRDTDTGAACSGMPLFVKLFAANEKVVSMVVVNDVIFVGTYLPNATPQACNRLGDSAIYAFDRNKGNPVAKICESANNCVAKKVLSESGIISDLLVTRDSTGQYRLLYTTSNRSADGTTGPGIVRATTINPGRPAVRMRAWRRLQ